MGEAYDHRKTRSAEKVVEGDVPARMEPTFSLAFFRKCKDGAVILNAEGRVGFINQPACDALGVAQLVDVSQRHWSDLWSESDSARIAAAIEDVLAGRAVRLANLTSPSGPLDMLGSPVVNTEGTVESIFAVIFPSGASPRISG